MERKTTFVVAGQFFETPEDKATVQSNLKKCKSIGVYLTDTSRTGHRDILLAQLSYEDWVAYIDKANAEIIEDWEAKYNEAVKAEEERQAKRVEEHKTEEVTQETLPVTE